MKAVFVNCVSCVFCVSAVSLYVLCVLCVRGEPLCAPQVYMGCPANVSFADSHVQLGASASEVLVPMAGNASFGPGVTLVCPTAAAFEDTFGGLYGPAGAYPVASPLCAAMPLRCAPASVCLEIGFVSPRARLAVCTSPEWPATAGCALQCSATAARPLCSGQQVVLASSLEFRCVPCAPGTYSLAHGASTGGPGPQAVTNLTCLPCPTGATCTGASVTPRPGYWGAPSGSGPGGGGATLAFAPCPTGYCCDGSAGAPCGTPGACAATRTGPLCGDCLPGYAAGLGSAECVARGRCAADQRALWPAVALGLLVSAAVQLTLVSGVWLCKARPSGKMKLVMYFAQVLCVGCRRCAAV